MADSVAAVEAALVVLSLRFRADRRESSCYEVAAVLEDLEAIYFAVPRALSAEEPVQRHILAEHHSRFESALGLSEFALGEIEYRVRALRHLEAFGADGRTLDALRKAINLVADSEVSRIHGGSPLPQRTAPAPVEPLHMRRLSMGSPLEIATAIPFEYWTSGVAFVVFLRALERRFNMLGRIRTEKVEAGWV